MKEMKQRTSEVRRSHAARSPVAQSRIVPAAILMLCFWALWAPNAGALGFRIPNQDAFAIARGNAFVATADNPSAIYYNPAGITQLEGQNIQAGSLFYLGIYADYDAPNGKSFRNDPEVVAAPTLQYTITPSESPVSFGFGVYEPFGFSVKWPNDVPFRQESLKGSLSYITMNPVVAWKVLPSLSIAAGPTFNYSRLNMVQGIFPTPIPFLSDDQTELNADGWSYGYNLGALWQPHTQWSFGASYRSSSRMDYHGDFRMHNPPPPLTSSSVSGATSELEFPQIVIGGVSYRPTEHWNLEFDVDWTDWSSIPNQVIQVNGTQIANQKLDWQASFMYELGVTRYFDNGYYLSAGYFYSEASTSSLYFTPMVPDTDLHIGSLGGGYKGQTWSWALALQIIGGGFREVKVDQSLPQTANGRYRLFTPTLSFNVGYHF
jgi:long-chain fatty acid transport protein